MSPRLHFRWWTPQDLQLAERLWSDVEVTRLIGGPFDARDKLDEQLALQSTFGAQYWPMFTRDAPSDDASSKDASPDDATIDATSIEEASIEEASIDDDVDSETFVGCAGLRPYDGLVGRARHELGFHLIPAAHGRGLATEAGAAVITWARAHRVEQLFAGHHPENAASARVLKKLGFVADVPALYAPTGLLHPSYVLDVT